MTHEQIPSFRPTTSSDAPLKEARLARDVTQVELARRLNKPQSFVTKYETGERRLDVVEFVRIAKALDFDPMVIMRELADLEVSVARL